MKTKQKIGLALFGALLITFFSACKKETPQSSSQTSYYMYMTDAPADYQQVNVNITAAQVNTASGWVSLNINAGVYNLLTLSNGKDTLLASGTVASGMVSQIRLILGPTGNTVKVNGTVYPLETPSAQQSGLKLDVNTDLSGISTFKMVLDFDAAMSVVANGSGSYILKPVIRANVAPTTGGIKGNIAPFSSQFAVLAIANADTSATFSSTLNGGFEVQGLASGTYEIVIIPQYPYRVAVYNGIIVNAGQVTDMGAVSVE
jgi:hypothetical protein